MILDIRNKAEQNLKSCGSVPGAAVGGGVGKSVYVANFSGCITDLAIQPFPPSSLLGQTGIVVLSKK